MAGARTGNAPPSRSATFRCYAELNDLLPPARRQVSFKHAFKGTPSIKDTLEALGIPHTEIGLLVVNGEPVVFGRLLRGGERVAAYPEWEALDPAPARPLRPARPDPPAFVLDVHLGRLARRLRLLGFDTLHRNDLDDPELAALAAGEGRILLTRDRDLLKHGAVLHGYWVRATRTDAQLAEVLRRFRLGGPFAPFSRCLVCNGTLAPVAREAVWAELPEHTRRVRRNFKRCRDCRKVYWEGSHHRRLTELLAALPAPSMPSKD